MALFLAALLTAQAAEPAPAGPGVEPQIMSIERFLTEAPTLGENVRVRVQGVVTHVISDRTYTIQDGKSAVYVFQKPEPPFQSGEKVEVSGFPSLGGLVPTLQNCTARVLGPGQLPTPEELSSAELLNPKHAMKLVRVRGRVMDESLQKGGLLLMRSEDGAHSFQVGLEALRNLDMMARPERGSLLQATGVLFIRAGADRKPMVASVHVQQLTDLSVIAGPPYWNPSRVGRLLGGTALALVAILVWVVLLRHQVKSQTKLIEQRFEREATMRALEDRFAKVYRATPDGLMITRASDDVVLEINPALASLRGQAPDQIVGRRESDLGLWSDPAEREKALTDFTAKGALSDYECALQNSRGERLAGVYAAEWIELNGERCRLGIFRNVTAQKRAEEEQRALRDKLERAQRMESLGTLAGGVAHDFNNLLAAILGNADLALEESNSAPEVNRCLQEIRAASLRGRDLVQRILAFSRPPRHSRQAISIAPVVAEAAALLRSAMPPGVWLETEIDPNVPLVMADATQIHQVVMNLGVNAAHAMEGRPGRVTLRIKSVTVPSPEPVPGSAAESELKPGLYTCVSVSDEGIGMTPAVRERIFEPFFTTKEPGRGTGLGLAAVHGLVNGHGGMIHVETEPNKGSTFSIYLPATGAASEPAAPRAVGTSPSARTLSILAVDDEELVLSVVKRSLQRQGHKVLAFTQPEEALACFCKEPMRFDLVLTDMNMPAVTGLQIAAAVHAARPELPILLASGNVSPELLESALKAGATRVISKPVSLPELHEAVRTIAG